MWESEIYNKKPESICFSSDGNLLFVATSDNYLDVYLTKTGQRTKRLLGHDKQILHLAYNPRYPYLVSSSKDGAIIIWDVEKEQINKKLVGHKGATNIIAFSPEGSLLISGSEDKSCILWNFNKIVEVDNM